MPAILQAAIAAPAPEPQTRTPRSASPPMDRLADLARLVRVVDAHLARVGAEVDDLVARRAPPRPPRAGRRRGGRTRRRSSFPIPPLAIRPVDARTPGDHATRPPGPASPLEYGRMAILIASNLRKELSGTPLFDGVSFKVERRDRLALAGRERRRQDDAAARARRARSRSRAASSPGRRARASRCTTSGRRRRAAGRCASTCSPARPTWPRSRRSCASSSGRWPAATTTPRTLARYSRRAGAARARGRLRLARPRRGASCAGSASPTTTSTGRSPPSRAAS